jgi:hypothetical protein
MQSIAEINKTQQKNDVTRSDYTLAIVGKKKEKKNRQALNHQTHQWRGLVIHLLGGKKKKEASRRVKPFKAFYFSSGCLRDKMK